VSAPTPALWSPTPDRQAAANVTRFLAWLSAERGLEFSDYPSLWRWSVDELGDFWSAVWDFYDVRSSAPVGRPLANRQMPRARWFEGARVNYAEQVLERAPNEGAAIIALSEGREPQEMSAAELRARVGAMAATLARLGVGEGDRVAAYLPNIPEAVIAMLATTSLGAVWAACAPDFGTRSVIDRFAQLEPKILIGVDGYRFGGVDHDRMPAVAELREALPSVRATILVRLLDAGREPGEGLLPFESAVDGRGEPHFRQVPFDHPLWILFSSGTTGLPKGIMHGHGGILLEHLKSLGLCMDLGPQDRYFFFSSTSWMAWNYLVSGLLHGSTIVLYNGAPAKPTPDALWRVAAETRATVLGMGSAYVSGCEKGGVELRGRVDLSHLRIVIPTGSPLPPGGWRWLGRELDDQVRIDSICGGTDVCTAFFGGSELLDVHPGVISCRWLGVDAHAFDQTGNEVLGTLGEFVVTSPMPSMPIGLWNDDDDRRLRAAYFEMFPGVWRQGDWITITADGAVTVSGRSDATLNRAGVRIGSAEIYGAVERLPEVVDSLVVGLELEHGDYYMPLFVVSESSDHEALEVAVRRIVREQLSPRHVPDEVVAVPAIPRTLTGKKLEVPIKRILQGVPPEQAAAMGSVDRPDALEWFASFAARRRAQPAETDD
jgi:acetoacetyl-CoA synthetase